MKRRNHRMATSLSRFLFPNPTATVDGDSSNPTACVGAIPPNQMIPFVKL
jgi:hypothetical protein